LLIAAAAVLAVALVGAAQASACGTSGYSYAGVGAPTFGSGISAVIAPLGGPFDIANGHVAGWVGVGGPGEGPNGTDEWLQIGLSGFPGLYSDVYYEVALPGHFPVYHEVVQNPPAGQAYRFAVRENRPNHWRVWMDGQPVSPSYYLPESHNAFTPIATAEGWDGGGNGACNPFLYRFEHVKIAHRVGGLFHNLVGGYRIASGKIALKRSGSSFLAAEGAAAIAALASLQL